MSAFVKLNNARNDRYLGLTLAKGVATVPGESAMGLLLRNGTVVGARKKPSKDEAPITGPQLITVEYGILAPHRYEAMLSAHPDMYKIGIVSHPILIPPGRETVLSIQLLAYASPDALKDLPWELALYLVD